ncbi:MAG: polysaccharide biosynthesis/export family protein [Chitinophagaceae bacterium]|nr:polysaccharide biosynthesis/export family protein [Chitinophagaceae bacterium]
MKIVRLFLFSGVVMFLVSCGSTKNLTYFNGVNDKVNYGTEKTDEVVISPNDLLSIIISSLSAEASEIFNPNKDATTRLTTITGVNTERTGYLVGADGSIQLPVLGKVMAGGLTKSQLKEKITNTILEKKLLVEPLVEIRFLNYEVTVIGEVGRPTVITVQSEKISLLKALGVAGDLTIYGKRDNVLLIREHGGARSTVHLDLTSPDFLKSPYYYLEPNDIVYVQPNRARAAQASMWPQTVPVLMTALSVSIIILDRILR